MIPNELLIRAKESLARKHVPVPPVGTEGMRLPGGQRLVQKMVAMAPIVRDLSETPLTDWKLNVSGEIENPLTLDFSDLEKLGIEDFVFDIHCVTSWSRLDQKFQGVNFSKLLDIVRPNANAKYVVFESRNDGYSTNVSLAELRENPAIIATAIDGESISLAYGGPIRMVIPHLYYWKSSKYVTDIRFLSEDEPGFWEVRGYHNHADPWKEERYSND